MISALGRSARMRLFVERISITMTVAEPVFVDTNILVYGVLTSYPLHIQAVQALEDLERAGVEI
jgi:hypothetical protein